MKFEENNWDTRETALVIANEKRYYDKLQECRENELYFMVVLYVIIQDWNERKEGNKIDSAKVNGNEVYIDFCGNEQRGWN